MSWVTGQSHNKCSKAIPDTEFYHLEQAECFSLYIPAFGSLLGDNQPVYDGKVAINLRLRK